MLFSLLYKIYRIKMKFNKVDNLPPVIHLISQTLISIRNIFNKCSHNGSFRYVDKER
ncbi:DUF4984 domain-containing protein [Bacillus toyonensis]|uniref:DUF4984 domain-containing protein n=1 Tax=Bacillus toyonensis TaxID=155322 RepID=UPI003BF9C60D